MTRYQLLEACRVVEASGTLTVVRKDAVDRMRAGIQTAMENLGIPGENYPAPVAVAYEALAQCLPPAKVLE